MQVNPAAPVFSRELGVADRRLGGKLRPMKPQSAYDLKDPVALTSNAVFSSPHSGREYPPEFVAASRLDLLALRASEDALVDKLFSTAPDHGAPLLTARMPRAWLDLNRAP